MKKDHPPTKSDARYREYPKEEMGLERKEGARGDFSLRPQRGVALSLVPENGSPHPARVSEAKKKRAKKDRGREEYGEFLFR